MESTFTFLVAVLALSSVRACNIAACHDCHLSDCDLILCSPVIDLSNRRLTGIIPARIGSLFITNQLDLSGNQLTGTIPGLLGQLILSQLDLSNNTLTGKIPDGLAKNYDPSVLTDFFTHYNKLTGPIPSNYCNNDLPADVCMLEAPKGGGKNHLPPPTNDLCI